MIRRLPDRGALIGLLAAGLVFGACQNNPYRDDIISTVKSVEARLDARMGVFVLDEGTGREWSHNSTDRFAMASTFKTLACGALLARVDAGEDSLGRRVRFEEADLVTYSPVMETRSGGQGVTLGEACEATLSTSDNTAANLVLEAIGGPAALTEFLRSIGDGYTRLDRYELDLNEATIGDPRDTTTPAAMAVTMKRLLLEDVLSPSSRQQLRDWLIANQVADDLFRKSLPDGWIIADRTGAGGNGTRGLAAVIWPPGREPVIAVVYITETDASFDDRNAAIAEIGAAIVAAVEEPQSTISR